MNHATTLVPKNSDGILRVALNGRISTPTQNLSNIEASFVPLKELLASVWSGEIQYEHYGEQSSGENINRPELKRLEKHIKSEVLDATMAEDLGRYARDEETLWRLLNLCQKHKVRLICPGDGLDTAEQNWKSVAHTAVAKHCGFLQDTRRRINRTASKSFGEGGHVLHETPGYRKLTSAEAAARSDFPGLKIERIDTCQSILDEVRRKIVFDRFSYAMIADYLNQIGFKPSPRAVTGRWNGPLVKTWLCNTILWGKRRFRVHLNGRDPVDKRKTVTLNPKPEERYFECLAFMTEAQFIEMHDVLNSHVSPNVVGPRSGAVLRRKGVPRRNTLFPRQQVQCQICHAFYYDAADKYFRCSNGLRRSSTPCWCHMQVKMQVLISVLIEWLIGVLTSDPDGTLDEFFNVAFEHLQALQSSYHEEISALEVEIANHRTAITRLLRCSEAATTEQVMLGYVSRADEHAAQIKKADREIDAIRMNIATQGRSQTKDQLAGDPRAALLDLATNSFEFGALMRRIIPKILITPIQAIDTGLMRPRLSVQLDLAALRTSDGEIIAPEVYTLNAFEEAQHFKDRLQVMDVKNDLLAKGLAAGPSAIASRLCFSKTRVCRALRLHSLMISEGLLEPYRVLTDAPVNASRQKKRASKIRLINAA